MSQSLVDRLSKVSSSFGITLTDEEIEVILDLAKESANSKYLEADLFFIKNPMGFYIRKKLGNLSPMKRQELLDIFVQQSHKANGDPLPGKELLRLKKEAKDLGVTLTDEEVEALINLAKENPDPLLLGGKICSTRTYDNICDQLLELTRKNENDLLYMFIFQARKANGDPLSLKEEAEKLGVNLTDEEISALMELVEKKHFAIMNIEGKLEDTKNPLLKQVNNKLSRLSPSDKNTLVLEFILTAISKSQGKKEKEEEENVREDIENTFPMSEAKDLDQKIKAKFGISLDLDIVQILGFLAKTVVHPSFFRDILSKGSHLRIKAYVRAWNFYQYSELYGIKDINKLIMFILNNVPPLEEANGDPLTLDDARTINEEIIKQFKVNLGVINVYILSSLAEKNRTPAEIKRSLRLESDLGNEDYNNVWKIIIKLTTRSGNKKVNEILQFIINYVSQ